MYNLLQRVKSLQWPFITVVKLKDKTHFQLSPSYCFSFHWKNYFERRWVLFEATRNKIKHDFRAILRSDVSVPSRSWQSVYGCKVVHASKLMKLSVINFNVLHSSMRMVTSANVVLHSLPCFTPFHRQRP